MRPDAITFDRTGCNDGGIKDMPDVEVAIAAVHAQIIGIQEGWAGYIAREIAIADAVGPGVVRQERHAVTQALLGRNEQRVVIGVAPVINIIEAAIILALGGVE